jgi:hypothetical protein
MKVLRPIFLMVFGAGLCGSEAAWADAQKTEGALLSTLMMLADPSACGGMNRDQKFIDGAIARAKEVNEEIGGLLVQSGAMAGVGAVAIVNFASKDVRDWRTYRTKWPAAAKMFRNRALIILGAGALSSLGAGALSSVGSNLSAQGKEEIEPKILLNQDAMEREATKIVRETAEIFSLSLAEESTVLAAVKSEVIKKARAGDRAPLDYYAVLKEAKFGGKLVFTGHKREILEGMNAAAADVDADENLDSRQVLANLAVANGMLSVCADSQSGEAKWKKNAKQRMRKNSTLIATELQKKAASPAREEDVDQPTLDVE